MNKPVYIVGAGGHAKVLLEILQDNVNITVMGFLEINPNLVHSKILDIMIYDQEKILKKYSPKEILLVNGIGSTNIPNLRKKIFTQLKKAGYIFFSVKHKTAYYSCNARMEEGVQLLARSIVLTGTKIGYNTIVNTNASIDHDCLIGNHVHIAPGAILSGGVTIEDNCHIGVGAIVVQGVTIGGNSLIAAGAVVVNNILSGACVAGIPAKNIRK